MCCARVAYTRPGRGWLMLFQGLKSLIPTRAMFKVSYGRVVAAAGELVITGAKRSENYKERQ